MIMSKNDSQEMQPGSLSHRPLAPVPDRFLAFALDMCLWLPLAFIPARPLWRKFQYHYMVSPGSIESMIQFAIASLIAVFVFLIAETLFVWKWGATPGKQIMRLQVSHVETGLRPNLGASFVRACTLLVELCLLGVPCLEILSHRKRRPWHDRLAETQVVSLKAIKDEVPHWLEVRFFRNIYWGLAACALVGIWLVSTGLLQKADRGVFKAKELETEGYLCETRDKAPGFAGLSKAVSRMDYALSQYRADRLSRACLESEADFAFWTQSEELMPWGHLIRGLLNKEDKKDPVDHFLLACPIGQTGAVCSLAKWFNIGEGLEAAEKLSWTGKGEKTRFLIENGRFEALTNYLDKEEWPASFATQIQDHVLRSHFLLGQQEAFKALYAGLKPTWSRHEKLEAASWSCWAETLAKGCIPQKRPAACNSLRGALAQGENLPTPALIALKIESKCANRQDLPMQQELDAQLRQSPEVSWVSEHANLSRLVKVAETLSSEHWASPYLLGEAVQAAQSESDFEKVAVLFQRFSRGSYAWWVAYQNFEKRAPELFRSYLSENKRGLSSVTDTSKAPKRPASGKVKR